MRALHTSDWHIGRTFHGANLLAEQESVLGHLADVVRAEKVDVVFVAGDIYDRAVPSAEAVHVATRIFTRIRQAGAELIVTAGNHDSAPRLGAFSEFAAAGGLHMRTTIDQLHEPVLLEDQHGLIACYGIPYLEPLPARHVLGVPEAQGHTGVLTEAMRRIRENLATQPAGTRSSVLAHAFVTGGNASESERTIAVGGVEQVPGSIFAGIDYVALGHLHGPQVLAEHLRYSGSPLAYSFSEAQHKKSVWLIDFDANGLADVRRHFLPAPRNLAAISGKLADLLLDKEFDEISDAYISATLTDRVRPLDAMRRLRERFSHAVHVDWQPEGGHNNEVLRYSESVRGRSDEEIVSNFLRDCRGDQPTTSEQKFFQRALEKAGRGEPQ